MRNSKISILEKYYHTLRPRFYDDMVYCGTCITTVFTD